MSAEHEQELRDCCVRAYEEIIRTACRLDVPPLVTIQMLLHMAAATAITQRTEETDVDTVAAVLAEMARAIVYALSARMKEDNNEKTSVDVGIADSSTAGGTEPAAAGTDQRAGAGDGPVVACVDGTGERRGVRRAHLVLIRPARRDNPEPDGEQR